MVCLCHIMYTTIVVNIMIKDKTKYEKCVNKSMGKAFCSLNLGEHFVITTL